MIQLTNMMTESRMRMQESALIAVDLHVILHLQPYCSSYQLWQLNSITALYTSNVQLIWLIHTKGKIHDFQLATNNKTEMVRPHWL